MWPQYLSLSTAHEFLVGKSDWVKKRSYYMRNISTFEPFIESVSQLIIKLCIWTFFHQDHLEKFQGDVNPLFKETWEQHFFVLTTCVSGLASVLGIIRFFKEGPVRFLPQTGALNGVFNFKFILTFFAILFNALAKILLLIIMLYYSLGVLAVFTNPPIGLDLVGTVSKPGCSNITMVQACLSDDTFQVRTHFPDEKYKGVPWPTNPEPEWRVFLRDEKFDESRIFWNAHTSEWWEGIETCLAKWNSEFCQVLTNKCGSSESIKIYCSENISVVTLSRLVAFSFWFSINILPQFLLASLVLLSIDVKGTFQIFLHFPELVLSPTITNMMFGPKDILWKCKSKTCDKTITLSPELCWINNLVSFLGNVPCLVILYLQFCKADPEHRCQNMVAFWDFLKLGSKNKDNIIALPPGLVMLFSSLSIVMSAFVIHFNSCEPKLLFLSPLECQQIEIGSFVHRLDDPKGPNDNPDAKTKGTKSISQMQHTLTTYNHEPGEIANDIEISGPFLISYFQVDSPILRSGCERSDQSLGTGHFWSKIDDQSHIVK